ncbi:hypothetical protein AT251_18765 [Enterovibrio nigricans]|nr:hypothetical protein AT251_18765 [Enterovibrio nigricans]
MLMSRDYFMLSFPYLANVVYFQVTGRSAFSECGDTLTLSATDSNCDTDRIWIAIGAFKQFIRTTLNKLVDGSYPMFRIQWLIISTKSFQRVIFDWFEVVGWG